MISSTPASARDTTHPSLAAAASFWNSPSSSPVARALVVSAILVIVGAPSMLRSVTFACVWID